jgi:hypothetical protein
LFQGLQILMRIPSINPMQIWNYGNYRQNSLFFNNGATNLIDNGRIDARRNKYVIVIYCVLALISHENVILSHIIMFHEQNETKQPFVSKFCLSRVEFIAGVSYEASIQPAHSQAINCSPMPCWSATERRWLIW